MLSRRCTFSLLSAACLAASRDLSCAAAAVLLAFCSLSSASFCLLAWRQCMPSDLANIHPYIHEYDCAASMSKKERNLRCYLNKDQTPPVWEAQMVGGIEACMAYLPASSREIEFGKSAE